MAESTVQVPVSLIEETMRSLDLDAARPGLVDDLDALLSQQTPTNEPPATYQQGYDDGFMAGEHHVRNAETLPAAPPSIADMLPGTTFLANPRGWTNPAHWVVANDGRAVSTDSWPWCAQEDIDPSTIRDVTPPKETS